MSIGPGSVGICTQAHRPWKLVRHDANMTVAGYSMPGLKPIDPAVQRACYLLLAGGVVVFAVALYVGFVRHGNSALVFSLLGVTTLVFSFTVFILVKPGAFAF